MADKIIDVRHSDGKTSTRGMAATGITGISVAAAAVVLVANDLVDGDIVRFSDCGGMTEINGLTATVSSRTATQFTTDIDTQVGFTAYSGSAGKVTLISEITGQVRLMYDDTADKGKVSQAAQKAVLQLLQDLTAT